MVGPVSAASKRVVGFGYGACRIEPRLGRWINSLSFLRPRFTSRPFAFRRSKTRIALDASGENRTLLTPIFALIVYRLGQEILNLQSGVRFPVGAPVSTLT